MVILLWHPASFSEIMTSPLEQLLVIYIIYIISCKTPKHQPSTHLDYMTIYIYYIYFILFPMEHSIPYSIILLIIINSFPLPFVFISMKFSVSPVFLFVIPKLRQIWADCLTDSVHQMEKSCENQSPPSPRRRKWTQGPKGPSVNPSTSIMYFFWDFWGYGYPGIGVTYPESYLTCKKRKKQHIQSYTTR